MKQIDGIDTNKWKYLLCSWIEIILWKCHAAQSDLQIQCNPYGIFDRNRKKKILKFVWNHKDRNSQRSLGKEQS